MSNLFAGVYGARFPEVVMNSGPLPPEGGLPAPLHDTPDARINYGATLLGDLQPYAYGEAGYMSSQSQNNQPHRIQKIIPELHLPEPNGLDTFKLSHAVDDSDLAFVMRLNRNSIFCTGTRGGTRRNTKVGTTVDPIINLPTLNYLLAGLQVARPERHDERNLWWEFLHNLDPQYWSVQRNYDGSFDSFKITDDVINDWPQYLRDCLHPAKGKAYSVPRNAPFVLNDIIHVIQHCVKPFGIVRGSEKQGGQHEMGLSPVTWTAPTIATLVIDGKEANVVNIWHYHDLHAGEDLVLRLKLMPVKTFTLNHYFKGFARKTFEVDDTCLAWQLVPDVFNLDIRPDEVVNITEMVRNEVTTHIKTEQLECIARGKYLNALEQITRFKCLVSFREKNVRDTKSHQISTSPNFFKSLLFYQHLFNSDFSGLYWQQLGYWHIGRTQVARPKYGASEFYNNDMANALKTNHIDVTFQPCFSCLPRLPAFSGFAGMREHPVAFTMVGEKATADEQRGWTPQLGLERFARPRQTSMGKRLSFERGWKEPAPSTAWTDEDAPPAKRASFREPAARVRQRETGVRVSRAPHRMSMIAASLARFEAQLAARMAEGARVLETVAELDEARAPSLETVAELDGARAPPQDAPAAATASEIAPVTTEAAPDFPAPAALADSGISETSRQELLEGLAPPPGKRGARTGAKARKPAEGAASRGPVDGTLLRPGAEPEPCRMELL